MDMDTIKLVWNFVVNPPQELLTATYDFGSNVVKCVTNTAITYGAAVIDIVKKTI